MENNTPTTTAPTTPAAPAPAQQPQAQTPAQQPTPAPEKKPTIPAGLTPEQEEAFKALANAVAQAEAAAKSATAKSEEPWYWNDFSRGVYLGATAVALATAGVWAYNKYVKSAE